MENKIIQDIAEIKGEMKYMSKTMAKLEKVLEDFSGLIEKQNVANKRILNLENSNKEQNTKIRVLEDWKLRSITYATIFATIGSTIVGIIIKKIL